MIQRAEIDFSSAWERPDILGSALKGDPMTWLHWKVCGMHIHGEPITKKADLEFIKKHCGYDDESLKHLRRRTRAHKEVFLIVGRRGGKSFFIAINAVYLATCKDWRDQLGIGEKGYVLIVANDRTQARIIKRYISGILNLNPKLKKYIEKETVDEIHLKNNIVIAIKTASFRGLRGWTCVAVILEEVAFYRSEESANPDTEIYAAVKPTLMSVKGSILYGIGTPYMKRGLLHNKHQKGYGKLGDPLILVAPSIVMNPTLSQEDIDEELRNDPEAARAEWLAMFRSDLSQFMPQSAVENCVISGRLSLPYIGDLVKYKCFIDAAGGSGKDSFTLAIAHKEKSGLVILDHLREIHPPFVPSSAVSELAGVMSQYRIRSATADRYGSEWVREAFRDHGISIKNSELTKSEIYLEFLPMILNGQVELLDDKRLVGQLANLERRTRTGGKDSVDHGLGLHDDCANSCAGICVIAAKHAKAYFKLSSVDMY